MADEKELKVRFVIKDDGSVILERLDHGFQKVKNSAEQASVFTGKWMAVLKAAVGPLLAFGTAALSIYQVKKQIGAFLDEADRFQKLSTRLNETTNFLSEMAVVADLGGMSAQSLYQSIQILKIRMGEFAQFGTGEGKDAFRKLGVEQDILNGKFKDAESLFPKLVEGINNLKNETDKSSMAYRLFGRSGVEMMQIIRQGSDEIEKQRNLARALGFSMDQDVADGAANALDALALLRYGLIGVREEFGKRISPVIEDAANDITEALIRLRADGTLEEWIDNFVDWMERGGKKAAALAREVSTILSVIEKLRTMGGLAPDEILGQRTSGIFGPIELFKGAFKGAAGIGFSLAKKVGDAFVERWTQTRRGIAEEFGWSWLYNKNDLQGALDDVPLPDLSPKKDTTATGGSSLFYTDEDLAKFKQMRREVLSLSAGELEKRLLDLDAFRLEAIASYEKVGKSTAEIEEAYSTARAKIFEDGLEEQKESLRTFEKFYSDAMEGFLNAGGGGGVRLFAGTGTEQFSRELEAERLEIENNHKSKLAELDKFNTEVRKKIDELKAARELAHGDELQMIDDRLDRYSSMLEDMKGVDQLYYDYRREQEDKALEDEIERNLGRKEINEEYFEWYLERLKSLGASEKDINAANLQQMRAGAKSHWDGLKLGFKEVENNYSDFAGATSQGVQSLASTFSSSLGGAMTDIIMGTKDMDQAFAEMGANVIRTIMDTITQLLIEWLIIQMIKGISSLASSGSGAAGGGGTGGVSSGYGTNLNPVPINNGPIMTSTGLGGYTQISSMLDAGLTRTLGGASTVSAFGGGTGGGSSSESAEVTINLINQSGEDVKARQVSSRRDGRRQIQDVVLESLYSSPDFRKNFRRGIGVGGLG